MFLYEFVYIRFNTKYISYCGTESHIEITLQRLSEWAGGEPDWVLKCPRMNQIEGRPTEHMATVGETHLLKLGPSWDDRCANMKSSLLPAPARDQERASRGEGIQGPGSSKRQSASAASTL